MLVIRKEQLNVFIEASKRRFEKELAKQLLESYPRGKFKNIKETAEYVRDEIQRALSYNINSETAIKDYVTASWILEMSIDKATYNIRKILEDHKLAQTYRAQYVLQYAQNQKGK